MTLNWGFMRGHQFSSTGTFEFETIRALWTAPFGGSDYGEVATIMSHVRPRSTRSWYDQWASMAYKIATRAEGLSETVSAGRAWMRASNYLREAEFYLSPTDPKRKQTTIMCREWFDAGIDALDLDVRRIQIPYAGVQMEALVAVPRTATPKDTALLVHGGFDSTLEELYFVIGAEAAHRGYPVMIFTGPGQGNLLRDFNMPFIPEWEHPTRTAIDAFSALVDYQSLVSVGLSFGGHLAARAAAFDSRIDGVVMFDYFPRMLDAFAHQVPRPLRSIFLRMPWWMSRLAPLYARLNLEVRWGITNGMWTFGVDNLRDLVTTLQEYDDRAWAGQITGDVLILLGEQDRFFDSASGWEFARRLTSARTTHVHQFSKDEGAHLHCQIGAIYRAHEQIFDWIAERQRSCEQALVAP